MAQVNPWNEIFYSQVGATSWNYDWKPNREYCVQVVEGNKADELGHSFIRIPPDMDLQRPSSGSIGWRVSGGLDHLLVAEIKSDGTKRFDLDRHYSSSRIVRILERKLVPDSDDLDPGDNTAEFELWHTTQGRSLTLNDFKRDYEYLFVVQCDQSSSEKYYSSISFFNFESAYRFSSKLHSRMIHYWGLRGWDDWFRLSGLSTTPVTKFKGPGHHKMYRIYRRRINQDTSKDYYNTIVSVAKFTNVISGKTNISRAKMPWDGEYIFATIDTYADNELCVQSQIVPSQKLLSLISGEGESSGFAQVAGRDHWIELGGTASSNFWWLDFHGGAGTEVFRRMPVEAYSEPPPPDPEPPAPPEPDPLVPCEERCLGVGDTFVSEVKVECKFINPPDWQLRNYKYNWKAKTKKLSLKDTESGGRIAIFKYTHTMREEDDLANIPYEVEVTVEDLDYGSVGVQDTDIAVLTFEHPCVIVNNETEFSINDISVPECTASETDRTATFTVTSSESVVGDDRTVEWRTRAGTAGGSDYAADSGTLTFSEGDTSKTIDITVRCDDIAEHDEMFTVELSNPSIGTLGKKVGTATIVDDTPNITTVELASEGESYQVYIFRDMSGSTANGEDITLNGSQASRDDTIVQILNDFAIPSSTIIGGEFASVSMFTSYVKHVLDNVPTSQKKVSILYITDATDGYPNTSQFYRYSSPSNNHPSEGSASTTEISVTDVNADESSTWNTTIGSIPNHIDEVKVTVVRILGTSAQGGGNAPIAEQGYNNILTSAPAKVVAASFETFDSYTTGEAGVLNDRISEAVLNTYTAYCAKDSGDSISVQAADENEAKTKAQDILNCPDD